jgi:hypothetical protein
LVATISANEPFSGIKVIEFCQGPVGPFCGRMLADIGSSLSRQAMWSSKIFVQA